MSDGQQPFKYPVSSRYFQIDVVASGDEFIACDDEAIILARTNNGFFYLITEPFPAFDGERGHLLPGGTVKKGEPAHQAAQRELMEEIGFKAGSLLLLGTIRPFSKYLRVQSHVFLATELSAEKADPDEAHSIGVDIFDRAQIDAMIRDGRIKDARVIGALQLFDLAGL